MKRPRHPMPEDVVRRLEAEGLRAAYDARPPYQRNDWLGWFSEAKRPQTRARRIDSMIGDLRAGHGYMGMPWTSPQARKARQ